MRIIDRFFRPPSGARFAQMLADAIRRAGERSAIRYDPEGFRLVTEGDTPNIMNLANLYGEYRAVPRSRRPAVLHAFVRSWFDRYKPIPELYEDLGPDLLLGICSRMFHEASRLEAEISGTAPLDLPHRIVGESYAAGLVYDLPQSMMLIQGHHLSAWGVAFEEALETACDNLREISRVPWESPAAGVLASPWRDHYDASRLLILDDLIDSADVDGDLVAMIPNRDTLLLAGSDDAPALSALAELGEEALKDPRPIQGYPLRRAADFWVPFLPWPDAPGFAPFHRLRMICLGRDYAEQAELLNERCRARGEDVFVASYTAMENTKTGESLSYCVWAEGVDTLLPETDRVFFLRPRDQAEADVAASGDWERVRRVVGHLMTPAGLHPERYRVTDFPTADQLAEIGAE